MQNDALMHCEVSKVLTRPVSSLYINFFSHCKLSRYLNPQLVVTEISSIS